MQGIIYIDATSISSLPEDLGKAAGIVFTKPTLIEVLRYKTSTFNREPVLFELPKANLADQIDYIMKVLENVSHHYITVFNKVPTLVIDSADTIAKRDEKAFGCLLAHCKHLANQKVMSVMLVLSEGHVIPKLNEVSERSRCAPVIHIPDISNDKAAEFLRSYGCSHALAEKVAPLCGGRLVKLVHAIAIKETQKCDDDEEVFKSVESHLVAQVKSDYQRSGIESGTDLFEAKVILLNTLAKKAMEYEELRCTKEEIGNEHKLKLALQDLLKGNFLVLREGGVLEFQTTLHKSYWMSQPDRHLYTPQEKI